MFARNSAAQAHTANINGQAVTVKPGETLLQAALEAGIAFPYSCRVGGCASCKCRLASGRVKELTETTYLLSDQELDDGYILACQSVPQSDLEVAVELSTSAVRQDIRGQITGQTRLTHDITRVDVQL